MCFFFSPGKKSTSPRARSRPGGLNGLFTNFHHDHFLPFALPGYNLISTRDFGLEFAFKVKKLAAQTLAGDITPF